MLTKTLKRQLHALISLLFTPLYNLQVKIRHFGFHILLFSRGSPEEPPSFHGTCSIFRRTKMLDLGLATKYLIRFGLFPLSIATCKYYNHHYNGVSTLYSIVMLELEYLKLICVPFPIVVFSRLLLVISMVLNCRGSLVMFLDVVAKIMDKCGSYSYIV